MSDLISRQAAIDAFYQYPNINWTTLDVMEKIDKVPSAQTEPVIPLSWIEEQIKWLKSLDNGFSDLAAMHISAMVNKWKDEQNG